MVDEKTYTIPLREEWLKVPRYKRAKKAAKALREFLIRHLKIRDKDFSKIKLDSVVNEALWSRGIKNPPHKITVKVKKEDDYFIVEFAGLPKKFKAEEKRFKKKHIKLEKVRKEKESVKEKRKKEEEEKKKKEEEKEKEKTEEEKKEDKEKKEKEKIMKKEAPVEKTHEFSKSTKAHGAEHRMALEK